MRQSRPSKRILPFRHSWPKPPKKEVPKSQLEPMSIPRDRHDPGPSVSSDSMIGDVQEGDYGLWLVVTQKKVDTKVQKAQNVWANEVGPTQANRTSNVTVMDNRPLKDSKRKLTVDLSSIGPNTSIRLERPLGKWASLAAVQLKDPPIPTPSWGPPLRLKR